MFNREEFLIKYNQLQYEIQQFEAQRQNALVIIQNDIDLENQKTAKELQERLDLIASLNAQYEKLGTEHHRVSEDYLLSATAELNAINNRSFLDKITGNTDKFQHLTELNETKRKNLERLTDIEYRMKTVEQTLNNLNESDTVTTVTTTYSEPYTLLIEQKKAELQNLVEVYNLTQNASVVQPPYEVPYTSPPTQLQYIAPTLQPQFIAPPVVQPQHEPAPTFVQPVVAPQIVEELAPELVSSIPLAPLMPKQVVSKPQEYVAQPKYDHKIEVANHSTKQLSASEHENDSDDIPEHFLAEHILASKQKIYDELGSDCDLENYSLEGLSGAAHCLFEKNIKQEQSKSSKKDHVRHNEKRESNEFDYVSFELSMEIYIGFELTIYGNHQMFLGMEYSQMKSFSFGQSSFFGGQKAAIQIFPEQDENLIRFSSVR